MTIKARIQRAGGIGRIALLIIGAGAANGLVKHFMSRPTQTSPAPAIVSQPFEVVTSTQDAEGVTQEDFNAEYLKAMEAYTIQRIKTLVAEHGGAPEPDMASDSVYVEISGRKLAVIRLRNRDGALGVYILGIIGSELKRVVCVRKTPEAALIPITSGPCGDRINEVFKVDL